MRGCTREHPVATQSRAAQTIPINAFPTAAALQDEDKSASARGLKHTRQLHPILLIVALRTKQRIFLNIAFNSIPVSCSSTHSIMTSESQQSPDSLLETIFPIINQNTSHERLLHYAV